MMFLSKYVSDVYYDMIMHEYEEDYLSQLDEEQFQKIYQIFIQKGFTYMEDIILRYLEIFELDEESVQHKLQELEKELGVNYVYIISNHLSLLGRIFVRQSHKKLT